MPINENITTVARNFAEYINRVAYKGEQFILMRGNKPVAQLSPVPIGRNLGDLPAIMASLPRLPLEEIEAFSDDLDAARRELDEAEVVDQWES